MSKIVFLNVPAHGHVNPTLPVVRELIQRGEQVLYYNTEEFRPQIERAGATFRAYPATALTSKDMTEAVKGGNLANASVLMLRSTETLLPFVLEELRREEPDLVIFDSLAVWAKMAATLLKLRAVASISHLVFDLKSSGLSLGEILLMVGRGLQQLPSLLASRRRLIRHYGKDAFPPGDPLFPMRDKLNLMFTARELHPDTKLIDGTFRFVGPSIDPQARDGDFPFQELKDELIIYISLGTIHNIHTEFYSHCFKAFGDYPAHFILSAGRDTDMAALGKIPANFTVRPSVPQLEVLQHADVFITHGGINSIHEGLYYGVPLILIPHQLEQLLNARRVQAQGAGLVLSHQVRDKDVTAADLRIALDTILSQDSYRTAAQEIQHILQSTGGYRQAADEIQGYMAETRNPPAP